MQVKKFEAPTIQEALDNIKRELGPEAIILQTKQYKRGFGLMSKASVEVTAAVSERSLQKKKYVESRMPEGNRDTIERLPAKRQADILDKYADRHVKKVFGDHEQVEAQQKQKKITATRYIDIEDPNPKPGQQKVPQAYQSTTPQARTATNPNAAKPASNTASSSAMVSKATSDLAAAAMGKHSVEDEVRHLKRMIEELKNAQEQSPGLGHGNANGMGAQSLSSPSLQDAFEQLVMNGIDKRYAFSIIKKIGFEIGAEECKNPDRVLDALASEIMQSSQVASPFAGIRADWQSNGPTVIALVGPTGVGKTTTVAKMASEAILKRNLKVGLINLDSYKVAAFDQLGTYAKILNVPFRSATTADELRAAIQDFKSLDLVLVDTTGRSQRDPNALKDMQNILEGVENVRTQIVLSAITRDAELYDMANRFSIFRPLGIIISKLDEATTYGSIYNVSQKTELPLLYFTTGQRVPEDIEEATKERVAALILDL